MFGESMSNCCGVPKGKQFTFTWKNLGILKFLAGIPKYYLGFYQVYHNIIYVYLGKT